MSRVNSLARVGRSYTAKFHGIRLKYWNPENHIICCFEGGEDVEFFLPHIRKKNSQKKIDFLICDGKSNVLMLWGKAIDKSWNLARLGFFVDRDLDDFIKGNPQASCVHVTQYYSFESHALDESFFSNVWQDLFRLPLNDVRFEDWRNAYFKGAENFARLLFPIFYVALATKIEGGNVNFDKIKLADVINISDSGLVRRVKKKERYKLAEIFPSAPPSRKSLRKSREELGKTDYRMWLRGKFLLWYSMAFLTRMRESLAKRGQKNRANVTALFNDASAVSCLCGRSEAPETLEIFLENWVCEIERNGVEPKGEAS